MKKQKDCKHSKVCQDCIKDEIKVHEDKIAELKKQLPVDQYDYLKGIVEQYKKLNPLCIHSCLSWCNHHCCNKGYTWVSPQYTTLTTTGTVTAGYMNINNNGSTLG